MSRPILLFQEISESLLFALLQIGLTVSVIGFILLLLRRVLQKRYPARIMCLIWAFLAIRLILPIQLTLPEPPVTVTPRLHYVQWNDDATSEAASPRFTVSQQTHAQWLSEMELQEIAEQEHLPSALHLNSLLLLIWLVGASIFLYRELHTYFSFKHQLYSLLQSPSSPTLQHILNEECAIVGIKRQPAIGISSAASCPQLLSAWHPLLVLPHTQFTDEDIRFVLRHELTHLRHGDLWLKYLLVLARALHWFNPLIHLLARAANEDIEFACDSTVVASMSTEERKKYGHTILNSVITQRLQTSMVSCFTGDKETLMKRFENLFDKHLKKNGLAFALVVALLTVGCGSAFAIGNTSQPMPTEKERIALAEAWGAQKYGNTVHTVRLDGERTLFISETPSNSTEVPYRKAEMLHFAQEDGTWQISNSTVLTEGDVQTLEDFVLLYENDLGLPIDADTLHLKGGQMEVIDQQDVSNDGNPDLTNIRYTFADGSVVHLQAAGDIVQNWSDAHGKNNRTAADLAQHFARAISHKTVWYLYPVLSEQNQRALARYQQQLVDSAPDGIWYSKLGGSSPSYRGYQILPDDADPLSCIVVFQMYGGGWSDSRCAYRVTIDTEHGRSAITNITPLTAETHTSKDLFALYYHTSLPMPTIQNGMNHYNGMPMESLTTPDSAIRTIFQTENDKCSFYRAKVTVQSQDKTNATVLLTFADGSGSEKITMSRQGDYWVPTGSDATTPT